MMNALIGTLRRPAFWLVAGGLAAAAGLGLINGWITGAALMTLLISIAPCLAMCALGLCMKGGKEGSCKKDDSVASTHGGRELP